MNSESSAVDVCFVLTPYAFVHAPSIGLGTLKASLADTGITSRIVHANLSFAEELGLASYKRISDVATHINMLGDWTFAGALFPDFEPDRERLFELTFDRADFCERTRNARHEVRDLIIDARQRARAFTERTAETILALKPKIVACSSVFQQHVASLALLKRIRQIAPHVITMIGGSNCAGVMGLTTLRSFSFLDYVVSGEADLLFPRLCRLALDRGADVAPHELPPGVMTQRSAVSLDPESVPYVIVPDLSAIPTPDYDEYFDDLKASPMATEINPLLPVETSRGCWWGQKHHCSFCGLMSGPGIGYRSKAPERVVQEFEKLTSRYDIDRIDCVDNMLDYRYLTTVMPALARASRKYAIFYETKANLRDSQVETLANAGVRFIQPGIESLHDEALRLLGKGTTAATNIQLLKSALRHGMTVEWSVLVGIPGDNDEWYGDMARLVRLITHLQAPHWLLPITYQRFSLYFEKPAQFGLDLAPTAGSAYVYPFSAETLANLVYAFDDRNDVDRSTRLSTNMPPGLKALAGEVAVWRHLWAQPLDLTARERPVLQMNDRGERITIVDTRPVATEVFWELTPLQSEIYRLCDGTATYGALQKALHGRAQPEDIDGALQRLIGGKLIAPLGVRYLSLAVARPPNRLERSGAVSRPKGEWDAAFAAGAAPR